jgi:predicted permease
MLSDFRFAIRVLAKAPGFTIAAVIVLALGIGVNTSIFSLVNTLLFQPPMYSRPAEIVQVFSQDRKNPQSFRGFSYPTYRDIAEQNTIFSGVLAYNITIIGIGEKNVERRAFAAVVTANYFSVLGVAPIRGRGFVSKEETPGRAAQVAVVSYSYWKKHQLSESTVGSTIQINGRPFTIVGIMPEGFTGTMHIFSSEVWVPMGDFDIVKNDFDNEKRNSVSERSSSPLLIVGRLKPGVTVASGDAALKTLATNLEQAFPVEQKDQTLLMKPLSRFSTSSSPSEDSDVAMLGKLLLCMSGVVLLVACLNLANMLLARGTARRKEIAIRLALGGGRARIVRQLVTEGFVLSLLGGIGGLLLALWSADLLVASLGRMLPLDIVWSTAPSLALVYATLGFCVLGTLCFAVGPALKLSASGVINDLKEHAGEDVPVHHRWKFLPRNPLVVLQIALSLALLTAAALFVRGANKAAAVDTGLKTDTNFLVEVDAGLGGHAQEPAREIYRRVGERLAALPGVEAVSISSSVPFGMISLGKRVQRAGLSVAPDAKPATAAEGLAFNVHYNSVGADYFNAVGLPLLRGRAFTGLEATADGPAIAIIDDALAKKLWPDGDALGQRIQYPSSRSAPAKGETTDSGIVFQNSHEPIKAGESIEIVGIVPTTRVALFEKQPAGALYVPFARGYQSNVFFHVKFPSIAKGTEAVIADQLRRAVREVDGTLPVLTVKTFAQHLDSNVQLWLVRAGAALFSIFGGLALALAVVGVYGVKAYAVARRTREIGIRMALGARPETVQWMILREGAVMLTLGIGLGLLLSVAAGQILAGLLYRVSALDPIAFTAAPLVLAIAALLACWLPARRATRISPMTALRTE